MASEKRVVQDFVEPDSKLAGTHSWLSRAILPFENGSHPPAIIFDGIRKEHRCASSAERRR